MANDFTARQTAGLLCDIYLDAHVSFMQVIQFVIIAGGFGSYERILWNSEKLPQIFPP